MEYRQEIVTPPLWYAVSLVEAKEHCYVTGDDQDRVLERCIEAAQRRAETETGRTYSATKFRRFYSAWLTDFVLWGKAPLTTIDLVEHLTATDPTVYAVVDPSVYQAFKGTPPILRPAPDQEWPTDDLAQEGYVDRIKIDFTCGYAAATLVPSNDIAAILMLVKHLFDNRSALVTGTIQSITMEGVRDLLSGSVVPGPYG